MGLVLTRREKEAIRIGDDVEVVIERISCEGRDRPEVSIHIKAPRDVAIVRAELLTRSQRNGNLDRPDRDRR